MSVYKIYKETALPGTLSAHSIYLVAPPGSPDFIEMYVTGASASTVKRIIDASQVQDMIDASSAGGGIAVVDDIAARNALTPDGNILVMVLDASADATVTSGAATYLYRFATTTWIKTSESESMDVVLNWSAIVGKPSSSAAAIDSAVANAHAHTNKTQLDKVGQDGDGNFTYNGTLPRTGWESTGW